MRVFEFIFFVLLFASCSTTEKVVTAKNYAPQILKTQNFLLSQQKENGSFQDSTNTLFNVWETILVCDALTTTKSTDNSSVLRGLKWLKANENQNGLICHNQLCKEAFCIETSALYLRLLKQMDSTINLNPQLDTISNLMKSDGSWNVMNPDVKLDQNFPSVTAFVLNMFKELHYTNFDSYKSYRFLLESQLETGTWGESWEYYGSPSYAIWQIYPLLTSKTEYKNDAEKLRNWLSVQQKSDGSWNFQTENKMNHISAELETAFILSALLVSKNDLQSKNMLEKGLAFLLSRQLSNGAWDGGYFPIPKQSYKKSEYLIVTSLTLKIIYELQQLENEK